MTYQLSYIELNQPLLAHFGLVHLQKLSGQTHQQTKDTGSDDPAPPYAPACAEVDEGVTDQAYQSTGYGAVDHGKEGQQAVLNGHGGICHGAGDGNEAA